MTRYGLERTDLLRATLGGRRVGLVTNPTGLDSRFRRSVDVLSEVCLVVSLFGPEHGVDGGAQAGDEVSDARDVRTGLPVYSLYGDRKRPTAEMLEGLDALVFDMQDVGLRYYTYAWTMSYVLEACREAGIPLVVLDRPNPLGGRVVEGLALDDDCRSFVGRFPVLSRHGLTLGELARHLVRTQVPGTELSVIPCEAWDANDWPSTGLPWVAPSPNLPTFESVLAYAATAFLEGTTLSEGRGTTRPFEQFGAPWLDAEALADALNDLDLPGLRWRPVRFTPTFSKFQGQPCRGVSLHLTDRTVAPLFEAGVHLHAALAKLHSDYQPLPPGKEGSQPPLALLWGTRRVLGPTTGAEVLAWADEDARAWKTLRQTDLLYER